MNKSKNKLSHNSVRRKKEKKSQIRNYKLYKEQEQLDFGKKRRKFTFKIPYDPGKYKKIFLMSGASLLGIFVIGIMYVFTGPTFRVQHIEATEVGKYELIDTNIVYKSLENIREKLMFDVNSTLVLDRLVGYQESIRSVSMKKSFPNTLILEITPYDPAFNVSLNGKRFFLLDNGSLVPTETYNPDLMYLGLENNFRNNTFLSYKKIYKQETIEKIQEILVKVAQNIPAAMIVDYYENERELHITFNNTTRVIFSLDTDITVKQQIKNMAILHKESNALLSGENLYIDLRIKNKAFLCSYENEATCSYNLSFLYPELERPNIEGTTNEPETTAKKEAN